MSIRSIDMQVLIPKATEVGKQQNNLTQQSITQQQQFAEQMQKMAEVRQHQVQEIVKSKDGRIERDTTKDRNSRNQHHNNGENASKTAKESLETESIENLTVSQDPIRGRIVDIKT
ncbi:hypothetical protein [Sporomusa acidovorans]|nr:hypothetical protein [Sporomusa acidovorans]